MKKLLSILGAMGLTAISTTSLVACNGQTPNKKNSLENKSPLKQYLDTEQSGADSLKNDKIVQNKNKGIVVSLKTDKKDNTNSVANNKQLVGLNSTLDSNNNVVPIFLVCDKKDNAYLGTNTGKLFKYNADGSLILVLNWNLKHGHIVTLETDTNDNIYLGTHTGNLLKSSGGQDFELVPTWDQKNGQISILKIDGNDNIYIFTCNNQLFKLSDNEAFKLVSNWDTKNGTVINFIIKKDNNIHFEIADYPNKIIKLLELSEDSINKLISTEAQIDGVKNKNN